MRLIKLFEQFDAPEIKTQVDLINILSQYDIPYQNWGTGKSKTVEDLFSEVVGNECQIVERESGLVRLIEFVGIKVFYKDVETLWFLKEDRQEFNDGRMRRRNMPTSVAEKMISGEDPVTAGVRGISEELDLKINSSQLKKHRDIQFNGGSLSYPGLRTKYKGHQFTCYLTNEQFNINGYVEVQRTKKTFFKWVKIESI
jgi:hypothetical protein